MLKSIVKIRHGLARQVLRWENLPGNLRGTVWILIAGALYTIMVTLIKIAGQTIHITEILLIRQALMMLLVSPVIIKNFPGSMHTSRLDLQLARIVCAISAMLLGFTAVVHLPLADVTTIGFGKAFFITVAAIFILAETVGPRRWMAIVVGFLGVIIVAQPSGQGATNIYGLMAITGSLFAAMTTVIIRKLTQTDKPVTILSYQAIGVGLFMTPPAIWYWKTPDLYEAILLLAIGTISVVTQLSNIHAYRAGEATAIAPLEYMRLLYATFLGLVIFGEWPNTNVFLGALIIIGAALYTIRRESNRQKS